MTEILVEPLRKDIKQLKLVPEIFRKGAGNVINGLMPNIYVASVVGTKEFNDELVGLVGFRYRRTSHHAEITWWGGTSDRLVGAAIQACQMQAVLEGRKRLECFNEVQHETSRWPRGGDRFREQLREQKFELEGMFPLYTDELEDADVLGWTWLEDGHPSLEEDTEYRLGRSERVVHYRNTNIELYKKDRDYYRRTDHGGKTFAEHIQSAQSAIESLPMVEIIEGWTVK